ncbi:MAG: sulfatase-like hydrolase/transferase [Alphaproteobacteria bacterium]|nr:sulfatase-like hydrolase/transferase [Alphaproteobacteria bacterium]
MPARNILVVMSDQHSGRIAGFAGHPLVRTPNMDALAARGTRFANAYTPSPICVPARASFATGLPVHRTRYWDNATAYDGRIPGWGHRLQAEGISVTSIGKLHYRTAEDPTGFDEQIMPMHIQDGIGQVWGLVRNPLPEREGGELMVRTAGPGLSKYNQYDLAITERTCATLREKAASGTPFVLYAGLVAPHFPYVVPQPWFDLYAQADIPRASPHPEEGFELHPWLKRFQSVSPGIDRNTPEERRRCTAAYYGLVSFLDDNLGRILATLDETGLSKDTLVVYTSDHGDMVGKRGQWGKSLPYEDSASIPMIVAGPDVPAGKVSSTPVSLLDLAQSCVSDLGLPPMADRPGRSLVELARAPDERDRPVLSEYHAYGSTHAWYMLRVGDLKYVHYVGYPPELFDLSSDPEELDNLAGRPALAEAQARLEAQLRALLDPEAVDAAAKADQARLIERYGGIEAALGKGNPSATPTPLG